MNATNVARMPSCSVRIASTIPVAAGMGSGAAVSVALIRALSAFLGNPLPDEQVSALAFEVEKLHHGTPSGIDNTVITYGQPVYFQRLGPGEGSPNKIEMLRVSQPFTLVIADTGISTPTSVTVGEVRLSWQADAEEYERLFDAAGMIAEKARELIEAGQADEMGHLLDQNHSILKRIGVSCPELDRLVDAARQAGALGAKLSGGGRGGNMLALVRPEEAAQVAEALRAAGAVRTLTTVVGI
jgi:mevalonate kinase